VVKIQVLLYQKGGLFLDAISYFVVSVDDSLIRLLFYFELALFYGLLAV
jgi:hypothetical protein